MLIGILAFLLPGTGAPGIALTPAWFGWFAWATWRQWKSRRNEGEAPAFLALLFAVIAIVWPIAYFTLDYHKPPHASGSPSLFASVRGTIIVLGTTFGPIQQISHELKLNELPKLGLVAVGMASFA